MLAVFLDYFEHGVHALFDSQSVVAALSRYFLTTAAANSSEFIMDNNSTSSTWSFSPWRTPSLSLSSLLFPFSIAVLSLLFIYTWRRRTGLRKNSRGELVPVESQRELKHFPKKEKVRFYYYKWLNRVNSLRYLESPAGKQRLKNTQIVRKIANNLIQRVKLKGRLGRRNSELAGAPRLVKKEPPASYLEEFSGAAKNGTLPAEVLSMMRAIRVFGHLEDPVFLELCRKMIPLEIDVGEYLFRPGDSDDSVYMVQGGRLMVFIRDPDSQREVFLKEVKTGESIASMLSILDVLSGNQNPFRTVTCRALEKSTVIRMPVPAFAEILERSPEALVRVVQLIMTRLQRVTFSALRDYLGLSHELMRSEKGPVTNTNYTTTPANSPRKYNHRLAEDEPDRRAHSRSLSTVSTSLPIPLGGGGKLSRSNTLKNRTPALPSAEAEDSPTLKTPFVFPAASPDTRPFNRQNLGRSVSVFEEAALPEDDDFERARRELVELLGLPNHAMLEDRLVYKRAPFGMYLVHEFDHESNLYYVVSGCLSVSQKSLDRNAHLFVAVKGELVGSLAVLTGEPSLFTVRAKVPSKVFVISRLDFFDIMREYPRIALKTAHCFAQRMSPFVRQIDFALDWEQVESGRAIYRQNDVSDSVYVVLNGRLRSVVKKKDGSKEPRGEFARGDLVGLTEVSIHKPRMSTVIAVRDTEIAKIPTLVLEYIKLKYPKVVTRLIQIMGDRIFGQMQETEKMAGPNLTTVAVIAVCDDVPLDAFCLEMELALNRLGTVLRLTSKRVEQNLGPSATEAVNEYRLATWLGQQEDSHRMVLFQCENSMTTWTKHCLRQADCVLIVGNGDKSPSVGFLEKELDAMDLRAEKRLVLLHRPETVIPKHTAEWLNMRGYVTSHHHIKCPQRVFLKKSHSWFEDYYLTKKDVIPDNFSGFARLARVLMGKSVGLVLGGGGARGCAHVGVIKSMIEAGIPIDYVGGTSIGSFIGALWCEELDLTRLIQRARDWSVGMTSMGAQLLDLTYPYNAMFKGTWFNGTIENTFTDRQIEDLWVPYFNVTTDITSSSMRVHKVGSLWRYVRASMSLSGYMPPLCDPVDGHLLLDGGYVNNLPADVMQQQGANFIIACDVGSQDDHNLTNYGDELSGWWLLWNRFNPFGTPVRIPTMAEVQTRLAYVSCVRTLEIVKQSDYCIYVRPPIESFKTLEFGKFDLLCELGNTYGKGFFAEAGIMQKVEELFEREERKDYNRPGVTMCPPHSRNKVGEENRGLHYTFTDLAQIVSQMKRSPTVSESSSSKEEMSDDDVLNMEMDEHGIHGDVDGEFRFYPKNLLETPPARIGDEIERLERRVSSATKDDLLE